MQHGQVVSYYCGFNGKMAALNMSQQKKLTKCGPVQSFIFTKEIFILIEFYL